MKLAARCARACAPWFLCLLSAAALAQPVRLNVASFNVGWWVSNAEFGQLVAQCSAPDRNWCDPRDSAQCQPTAKGLPPCNAYAEYHRPVSGGAPVPVVVPTPTYWEAKRQAIEQTLRSIRPDVIAFQEISGEQAARAVFGSAHDQYAYCTSTDRDPQNPQAQRLVIAVRKSAFAIASCQTDQALAVEDVQSPGHFTRPGLIADLSGPAGRLKVANLHLKSGCASPAGDPRFDFRGAYLDSTENKNCPTLRKQVEPLERLIERETATGSNFVLLGDFNRKLDLELDRKAGDVRAGGGSAQGIPAPAVAVRLLWPEVNDRDPAGSELMLLRREPRASECAANEGLDHIAMSQNLAAANAGVRSREVDMARFAGGMVPASDHCPLAVQISLP